MPIELIITIAAGLISVLLFLGLLKIVKATLGTAFKIALIALGLQLFFGIGPQVIWQRILQFLHQVWR
jgi:hypothetical protein